jgi:hypothetical protein
MVNMNTYGMDKKKGPAGRPAPFSKEKTLDRKKTNNKKRE